MRPCLKSPSQSTSGSPSSSSTNLTLSSISKSSSSSSTSSSVSLASPSPTSATAAECTQSTLTSSAECVGSTLACRIRKCVAFQEDACLETVWMADEWDRTPTEPARKLSYQDLLELKEIQRSLPRANQPPDLIAGRAGKQYLSGVPISLLPLLPSSDIAPPTATPPPSLSGTPPPGSNPASGSSTPSYSNPSSSSWNSSSRSWNTSTSSMPFNNYSNSHSSAPSSSSSNAAFPFPPRSNWTPIQTPKPTSPSSPSVDPSGQTRWVSFAPDSPRDPGSLAGTSPPRNNTGFPQLNTKPVTSPGGGARSPPAPTSPQTGKQKRRFAFLPLLDSPSDTPSPSSFIPATSTTAPRTTSPTPSASSSGGDTEREDPPTPSGKWETSRSSNSAYSGDAEPPFFQLPPPKRGRVGKASPSANPSKVHYSAYYDREGGDYHAPRSFGSAMGARSRSKSPSTTTTTTSFGRSNPAFQPKYPVGVIFHNSSGSNPGSRVTSPVGSRHASPNAACRVPYPSSSSRQASPVRQEVVHSIAVVMEGKKKNVMVINGIEVDLDEEEEEEEKVVPPVKEKKRNVMVINGIEIDLDDDDDDDEPTPSPPPSAAKKEAAPPSSPIAQPRPISPAVSRSPSSPKAGGGGGSGRSTSGLPTPPPSTSPSPVPSWRALPVEEVVVVKKVVESEGVYVGLHAPVTFKRRQGGL